MSEEEYEKFEITKNDYNSALYNSRRRNRLTKKQQIYGIWNDDSDDSGSGKYGKNSHKQKGASTSKKNYSAPVSFVAGGIQQAGQKKTEAIEKNENDDDDDDEENESTPKSNRSSNTSDSSDEVESHSISDMAGFRTTFNNPSVGGSDKSVANWEKHTRGIGAKLLLQMGYEPGKGLGKNLQGISQPVSAHKRQGRGAIGAYGPEPGQTIGSMKNKIKLDEDELEIKEFKQKMQHWRKDTTPAVNLRGNNNYYKSVNDIIEKGKNPNFIIADNLGKKMSNVTVIDMTGPEKRVLSGYHALAQTKAIDENLYDNLSQNSKKVTNFSLAELMHNINLIVDMCEQDIIATDKAQRTACEREKTVLRDKENLEKIVELEEKHINTLEDATYLVQSLTEPVTPLSLEEAAKIFITLKTDYAAEYKEFGLGDLAPGVIAPLFNVKLDDWRPLEEPTKYVNLLREWSLILGMNTSQPIIVFDPYSSLVWAGIMPSIRSAVASWNPRVHEPMAALLGAWSPLFPTVILDNILEKLVLPRICTCVEDWDPLTDTIPIHTWILPWNGLLKHKMEKTIYPIIRDKLGIALNAWLPSDRSALAMLLPWKNYFSDGDLQSFIVKHILPKLQMCLNELIINPLQQDLELWNQVWEWHTVVSLIAMKDLLEKFFFPKWLQTLVLWLNQSPNLDQVSRWYSGWKSLLSEEILQQPSVKENFRRALELMHRSTGGNVPTASSSVSSSSSSIVSTNKDSLPPALMDLQIPPPPHLEFRDIVSQKCSERGIIFTPLQGRREDGKQIYRIGKLFCYIDRSVIMVSDGSFSNWTPISMVSLLDRAGSGVIY